MYWDSRPPQYDCPSISKSSVGYKISTTADLRAVLKSFIGGFVFREVLSDSPNDEIAISTDLDGAREWFNKHVGGTEEDFQKAVAEAKAEIIKDLRSPAFQKLAWDTAREFAREVFPAPKLTSSLLRARRLGWAQ